MSFFSSVEMLPEDPILSLPLHFAADKKENKVNLGIGSYKDEQGKSKVLSSVRKAEELVLHQHQNKEYLPIQGNQSFLKLMGELAFGSHIAKANSGELFLAQSVGGTGALRIGAELIARNRKVSIYIPEHTWLNHRPIFKYAGLETLYYPYLDKQKHNLDFISLCNVIKTMPESSVMLLHACCHNPTGIDPTEEQWKEIAALMQKRKILPFFDCAYLGFGNNLEKDAFALRYFVEQGFEMMVSVSAAKNFGLYGERVGLFGLISHDIQTTQRAASQVKQIIRSNYSNPPLHGVRIVTEILQSEPLKKEWEAELAHMRERIKKMRHQLVDGLKKQASEHDFAFFEKQLGMFSYTGFTEQQVQQLKSGYGIYMTKDGRVNVAGLNENNIDYVIAAFAAILTK